MKIKFSIKLVLAVTIMTVVSSCKKFLDVNENPNFPAKVNVNEVFPSAEAAIAHVVGNDFQIYGGIWAQHWTQNPSSSQYKTIEQYSPSSDDFDTPWRILYAEGLQDLNFVIAKGTAQGKTQYVACAKILEAYTYQILTDNFGDIPFSDALKGESAVLTPKYDSQKAVYAGIQKLLDEAIAAIDLNATNGPQSDDILLKGNMQTWQKFAYTLKLRAYLRLSEVDPVTAQAGIQAMEADAVFLAEGDEVKVNYTSSGGNTNPLYSSIVALSNVQNLVGSSTTIDSLLSWGDDRLPVFYNPLANGTFAGIKQGNYNSGIALTSISLPSALTGAYVNAASATAPVKLMTGYESLFLQSEAVARGWLTGDAQSLYEEAIIESYTSYGLDGATLAPVYFAGPAVAYPAAGTLQDQIKAIITQKWVSLCGNSGTEAWSEWRRTGYPALSPSLASTIGGTRMPARMLYPSSELNRNPNNPGQKFVYDKVWWDVN